MRPAADFLRSTLVALALAPVSCQVPASGPAAWIDLLPAGETGLGGWTAVPFGGEGEVRREGQALLLGQGLTLTGVRWGAPTLPDGRPLPRDDYEIEVVAVRRLGTDFFCGLTFPVGDRALSLILGGWGGATCGLSCLDGADASSNETTCYRRFTTGKPYRLLLRVADGRVEAELDGRPLLAAGVADRRLDLRPEIAPGGPLGVASYQTEAAILGIRLRRLGK
ncbi:MAG: DUF1080 domain-containing protein [Planctomycetota bacterium]|nr:MAG: DUF1080 domain-containing protein [Planctomycetota bacterium]